MFGGMMWWIGGMDCGRLISPQFTQMKTLLPQNQNMSVGNGLNGPSAVPHVVVVGKLEHTISWMELHVANHAHTAMATSSSENATLTLVLLIARVSGVNTPRALQLAVEESKLAHLK